MPTFVMLTRLSPDAVESPAALPVLDVGGQSGRASRS